MIVYAVGKWDRLPFYEYCYSHIPLIGYFDETQRFIIFLSRDLMEYKEWEVKASDDPPDCQAIPNYPKNGTKMDWDRQCTDIGR